MIRTAPGRTKTPAALCSRSAGTRARLRRRRWRRRVSLDAEAAPRGGGGAGRREGGERRASGADDALAADPRACARSCPNARASRRSIAESAESIAAAPRPGVDCEMAVFDRVGAQRAWPRSTQEQLVADTIEERRSCVRSRLGGNAPGRSARAGAAERRLAICTTSVAGHVPIRAAGARWRARRRRAPAFEHLAEPPPVARVWLMASTNKTSGTRPGVAELDGGEATRAKAFAVRGFRTDVSVPRPRRARRRAGARRGDARQSARRLERRGHERSAVRGDVRADAPDLSETQIEALILRLDPWNAAESHVLGVLRRARARPGSRARRSRRGRAAEHGATARRAIGGVGHAGAAVHAVLRRERLQGEVMSVFTATQLRRTSCQIIYLQRRTKHRLSRYVGLAPRRVGVAGPVRACSVGCAKGFSEVSSRKESLLFEKRALLVRSFLRAPRCSSRRLAQQLEMRRRAQRAPLLRGCTFAHRPQKLHRAPPRPPRRPAAPAS